MIARNLNELPQTPPAGRFLVFTKCLGLQTNVPKS